MKKLFLLLICFVILVVVSSTGARMTLMDWGGQEPAAGKSYLLGPIGWESGEGYTDTQEWDNGGDSWTETAPSTDLFVTSSAVAPPTGTQFGKVTENDQSQKCTHAITAQNGVFTVEYDVYYVDCSGASTGSGMEIVDVGTNDALSIKCTDSDIWLRIGGDWVEQTADGDIISNGTWYHIEIELDMTNDTNDMWIENTKYSNGVALKNAGTSPDQIQFDTYAAENNDHTYYDNLEIYSGVRQ